MNVLVMNPGGNSLKVELVACSPEQRFPFDGVQQVNLIIEGIGKQPCLSLLQGSRDTQSEPVPAKDYGEAAASALGWIEEKTHFHPQQIDCVGVRVVHGGEFFREATKVDAEVERRIEEFERLAPLHNKSSLQLLEPIRRQLGDVPIYAVFDTAFHRTMPEVASLYAIPIDLAQKYGIRRYGFHGSSHRYMVARAAYLLGKDPGQLNLVTLHLESGCSATAIANGRSVDNTMGLTPLEGLMMGTRSGDVDPSLVALLIREQQMEAAQVMTMLNRESGLLAVSRKSLDTRVLMQDYGSDPHVTLAMDMFCYRVTKAVGAYLAVLGGADAVVFGGGIGQNTPLVRERVGQGLRWSGLEIDAEKNRALIDAEGLLSPLHSKLAALVVITQEGLQIAHECSRAMASASAR